MPCFAAAAMERRQLGRDDDGAGPATDREQERAKRGFSLAEHSDTQMCLILNVFGDPQTQEVAPEEFKTNSVWTAERVR